MRTHGLILAAVAVLSGILACGGRTDAGRGGGGSGSRGAGSGSGGSGAGSGSASGGVSSGSCAAIGASGAPPPALPYGGNATTHSVRGPFSGLCLSPSLPVDAAGLVDCAVFYALSSGDTCAAHEGLTAVAPDVLASLRTLGVISAHPLDTPLCVLAQLPRSQWVDGSCATSSRAGWCYVAAVSAGFCSQQTIPAVVSPSGKLPPDGAFDMIACGVTPPGVSAGTANVSSVGVPCVPSPELCASFSGFKFEDVTLDENNAACGTAVCLVNHFQGLTTCPYGQPYNQGCTVPGTTGAPLQPVQPQCDSRRTKQTVYCSCRCANAEGNVDDGATYCSCPSGYTCTQLVPAIQSGDPRAGAYCIKSGTALGDGPVGVPCSGRHNCNSAAKNCP
jgi:hypothetical protein